MTSIHCEMWNSLSGSWTSWGSSKTGGWGWWPSEERLLHHQHVARLQLHVGVLAGQYALGVDLDLDVLAGAVAALDRASPTPGRQPAGRASWSSL